MRLADLGGIMRSSGYFEKNMVLFVRNRTGHFRFTVTDKNQLHAVGDWVAIAEYDEDKALKKQRRNKK